MPNVIRRRDYFLVPLVSLLTIVSMLGATEIGTRVAWPSVYNEDCLAKYHGFTVAKPNCTVRMKAAEGPWVTYHFNACGYRTYDSCGPKPPGTLRIALLGSSSTEGFNVPLDETFGERTGRQLTKMTGRKVQIENMGMEARPPIFSYVKLTEALQLNPDLIVFTIGPFDLDQPIDPVQMANRNNPDGVVSPPLRLDDATPLKRAQFVLNDSRTLLMTQHFLFSNTDTYLRLYMGYGSRADYLKQPLSARWQALFANFDLLLKDMAARTRAKGIPLLIMVLPSRAEAALLGSQQRPPNSDPYIFCRKIEQMAADDGIGHVDVLDELGQLPHPENVFYPMDLHVNGEGNALIAKALVSKCLDGSVPALAAVHESQTR